MKNTIFFVNLIMCLWENLWTSVLLILLTAALRPMTVTAAELLTTSRMNLEAEEFLTLVNVLYCTRVKECKCFHPWSSNESLHYYLLFFLIENINLVEGTSCIAFVCKCVLLKGKSYDEVNFHRERYVAIDDFEARIF